jgi:hypothetical protein
MSEGEAYRRILAARLGRKFPIVTALLASGAVHLSALELLRDHLTEENHAELLEAASGKSKREVQQMVATRFPQPDASTKIRKLPARRPVGARPAPKPGPVPRLRARAHFLPGLRLRLRLRARARSRTGAAVHAPPPRAALRDPL